MGIFLGRWFGIGLDILEGLIKANEEKIALLEKADKEKYANKIEALEAENEEINTEIKRRETEEETN